MLMEMFDFSGKKKIIVGFILLALGGLSSYFAVFYYKTSNRNSQEKVPSVVWELVLDRVSRVWSGDFSLQDEYFSEACSELSLTQGLDNSLIPKSLKACHPYLFRCFFEGRKSSVKHKTEFFNYEVLFKAGESKRRGASNLEVDIKVGEDKKSFELTSFCRQVELPQGVYWADNKAKKEERLWHTSGIRYFIDKHLVRNLDVKLWLAKKEDLKRLEGLKEKYGAKKGKDLFSPSVDLLPEEMKAFCSDRRQEVLSSRVKAAITFHHGRKSFSDILTFPPSFNTPPHPFGLRLQESPAHLAAKGAPYEKKEACLKIKASECHNSDDNDHLLYGMGWLGVSELLGGPAEYVVNLEFPRKNLHPSSYYHAMSSRVHEAGVRVFWSGRGHRRIDFNFFTTPFFENSVDHYDVGFRCMKKILRSNVL